MQASLRAAGRRETIRKVSIDLTPRGRFRHPTVEALARALEPAALPSPGRSRDGGEARGAARRDLIRQRRGAAVRAR